MLFEPSDGFLYNDNLDKIGNRDLAVNADLDLSGRTKQVNGVFYAQTMAGDWLMCKSASSAITDISDITTTLDERIKGLLTSCYDATAGAAIYETYSANKLPLHSDNARIRLNELKTQFNDLSVTPVSLKQTVSENWAPYDVKFDYTDSGNISSMSFSKNGISAEYYGSHVIKRDYLLTYFLESEQHFSLSGAPVVNDFFGYHKMQREYQVSLPDVKIVSEFYLDNTGISTVVNLKDPNLFAHKITWHYDDLLNVTRKYWTIHNEQINTGNLTLNIARNDSGLIVQQFYTDAITNTNAVSTAGWHSVKHFYNANNQLTQKQYLSLLGAPAIVNGTYSTVVYDPVSETPAVYLDRFGNVYNK